MSQPTRKQSPRHRAPRRRSTRGVTIASLGIGLAVATGSGIANADPASPASPGVGAADIASSLQHQASDAHANVGRTPSAQGGNARPAAATGANEATTPGADTPGVNTPETGAPRPTEAKVGEKPDAPKTPIRDAIVSAVKASVLNKLTGGFGKLVGPSR